MDKEEKEFAEKKYQEFLADPKGFARERGQFYVDRPEDPAVQMERVRLALEVSLDENERLMEDARRRRDFDLRDAYAAKINGITEFVFTLGGILSATRVENKVWDERAGEYRKDGNYHWEVKNLCVKKPVEDIFSMFGADKN